MGKTKVGEKSECTSFNCRKFSTRAVVKVNKREAQCRKNQPKRLLSVKKLLPDDGHVVFFFLFLGENGVSRFTGLDRNKTEWKFFGLLQSDSVALFRHLLINDGIKAIHSQRKSPLGP